MSTHALVEELKENDEDFEFYPTTKEMIKPIIEHIGIESVTVLDIGCGTCNFKAYFNELKSEGQRIEEYYVIEKSKTLINRLHKDTIVLGTDFNSTTLIDKKADVVFCNPPYSDYENWAKRILLESNCKWIYLVIPQRWKESKGINGCIKELNLAEPKILGSFDFLNAERQARAKVDVLFINKNPEKTRYGYTLSDINEDAFSKWFDETFKFRDKVISEYEKATTERVEKENIKAQLVGAESKAKMLVDLYQNEQKRLYEHFMAISSLDLSVLETIGVSKSGVKTALKQKIKSLKILYWQIVFDELEEITTRLTSKTREKMLSKFKNLLTVDFTVENIYPLIIWVIKNANDYYNEQLIDFFKELSDPENVKPYKSNQKTFKYDRWRFNADTNNRYTLDYRIVCRYLFKTVYRGFDDWQNLKLINDICVIANNIGFEPIWENNRQVPKEYGVKYLVPCKHKKDGVLFEYRVYKNGNTHIKLNKEFAKALNVEASRLLGWIRDKEDIKREFATEMAEGAEKYFKANTFLSLNGSGLKLLGVNPTT